jgi:hypothetical protein
MLMRLLQLIAFFGLVACLTVHVWTFTAGWTVDQAYTAVSILGVAMFPLFIPASSIGRKQQIGPLSTSKPAPSLVLALVPHLLLYAMLQGLVWMVALKLGKVGTRGGRYFQYPWLGRNNEWEIDFATYKRGMGFSIRCFTAFLTVFYLSILGTLLLHKRTKGQARTI